MLLFGIKLLQTTYSKVFCFNQILHFNIYKVLKIKFEYEVDLITEGRKPTVEEEYLVLGSVYWALMSLLPHGMVKQYFLHWNEVVKQLHAEMEEKAKKTMQEGGVPQIVIEESAQMLQSCFVYNYKLQNRTKLMAIIKETSNVCSTKKSRYLL